MLVLAAWPHARTARQQPAPPASATSDFKVFVRGSQIGTEQVTVERSSGGVVISGSGRLAQPVDVITNRCEVRYDAQWRPLEANFDAVVNGQYAVIHTVFSDGNARSQIAQSGRQTAKTDKVTADAVVLLNSFFGLYEAVAARLQSMQAGAELRAYLLPQQEVPLQLKSVADERIQTPGRTIATRHYVLSFADQAGPLQVDLWADQNARLLRLSVPARSFDMAREDIATVSARRETMSRAGDEQVRFAANGFMLAGTVSKPAPKPPAGRRFPAVVLVGSATSTDRDENMFGVPVFGEIASALADAGFLVLRYDKRGVGQSGGRADSVTVEDYGEDARAALKYVRGRKDVDKQRVALLGYTEGGWAAMLAAARNKDAAALVLVATPGVTGADLVLAQQKHRLDRSKMTPADRQKEMDLQKKIQEAVLTGNGWESIRPDLRKRADTEWFHSFLAFDPAKVMRNVRQPVFVVQGELDTEIFPTQADRLAQLARSRKAPLDKQVEVLRVPGVNHLLVPATTGEREEYAQLSGRNVSTEVVSAILSWLKKTAEGGKR